MLAGAVIAVMALSAVACSGGRADGPSTSSLAAGNIPASLPNSFLSGDASPYRGYETYSGVASYLSAQGTMQTGIWVTGAGSADAAADTAIVYLGVEARAETVAEARDAAATAMTSVLDAIKELGVDEADIKTTYFNIQPETRWIEKTDSLGQYGEPQIIGYIVTNQVEVKVRDLDDVSSVLDTAATEGGDLIRINSISFTVSDPAEYAADMRRAAAEDARAKAQLYADAMGVELGDLIFLTETGSSTPLVNRSAAEAGYDSAAGAPPTPIQGGDVSLSTTIQAAFAIVP
jgi:uncharacterized protein YggE